MRTAALNVLLLAIFLFSLTSIAEAPQNLLDVLPISLQSGDLKEVPVHVEWPFVAIDGRPSLPKPFMEVNTLEEIDVSTSTRLLMEGAQLNLLDGGYVLNAATAPPGTTSINLLDLRVSLSLQNVTTWDALVAVCKEVSGLPEASRPLIPISSYASYGGGPAFFGEDKIVTLEAVNESVRSLVIRILQQALMTMSYKYEH